jgi:hypothetical protein
MLVPTELDETCETVVSMLAPLLGNAGTRRSVRFEVLDSDGRGGLDPASEPFAVSSWSLAILTGWSKAGGVVTAVACLDGESPLLERVYREEMVDEEDRLLYGRVASGARW